MDVNLMDGGPDVRERIIAAANDLYARNGSGKFPSVAAVRHVAQADMNTTSAVMQKWRRERQLPPTVTAVPIPESVVHQANVALSTVWNGAVELATFSRDRAALPDHRRCVVHGAVSAPDGAGRWLERSP